MPGDGKRVPGSARLSEWAAHGGWRMPGEGVRAGQCKAERMVGAWRVAHAGGRGTCRAAQYQNERMTQSTWENSARVRLAVIGSTNYLPLGEIHGHDLYILEHDPQQFRFLLVLRFKTRGSQQRSYWKLE